MKDTHDVLRKIVLIDSKFNVSDEAVLEPIQDRKTDKSLFIHCFSRNTLQIVE